MAEQSSSVISSQATDNAVSRTITISPNKEQQDVPALKLRLKKPKKDKRVEWSTETVDNENLNKKKSKCCCIYEKPRKSLDESSSSEDENGLKKDECDHCFGHVELRAKSRPQKVINAVEKHKPSESKPAFEPDEGPKELNPNE